MFGLIAIDDAQINARSEEYWNAHEGEGVRNGDGTESRDPMQSTAEIMDTSGPAKGSRMDRTTSEPEPSLRGWAQPRLICLGTIRGLTASGSGSLNEVGWWSDQCLLPPYQNTWECTGRQRP